MKPGVPKLLNRLFKKFLDELIYYSNYPLCVYIYKKSK